ncbi:MAG: glycosyltransferase family 8 protein [Alphaproteobacteria bacterium]|nr:glycosyltransferase family 8 protein [Alphaproteobacteria bacterium]
MISNSIIFSVNNTYVSYLAVCLKSLLAHIREQDKYEVYVLNSDISEQNMVNILSLQQENLHISFVDMREYIDKGIENEFALTEHFTIETYYRFFLPQIFPDWDKVLYLDADTLVLRDIKELCDIDISDNYLGVTHDCEIVRASHIAGEEYSDYFTKKLGVDIEQYFQAGVMIVNLKKMREDNITQKLLEGLKKIKTPKFVDQDILNMVCFNKVKYISQNWDYTWHLPIIDDDYLLHIGETLNEKYEEARKHPYIIHFTGNGMKPTDYPNMPEAKVFWQYVGVSPYKKYFEKQLKVNFKYLSRKLYKKKIKLLKYKILDKITYGDLKKQFQHRQKKLQQQIVDIKNKMRGGRIQL